MDHQEEMAYGESNGLVARCGQAAPYQRFFSYTRSRKSNTRTVVETIVFLAYTYYLNNADGCIRQTAVLKITVAC